jgi:hypothetical protein
LVGGRTTHNIDNMGKTAETMTTQDSTRMVTKYKVQAQELNTRFAQRALENWIDASRSQTELGKSVAQQHYRKTNKQTGDFRSLYGQWIGLPWSVPFLGFPFLGFPFSGTSYGPRSFQRRGMRLGENGYRDCGRDNPWW